MSVATRMVTTDANAPSPATKPDHISLLTISF